MDSIGENGSYIVLLDENGERWNPTPIQDFTSILKIPMIRRNNAYTTSKNIAYSLQYLQLLQKILDSVYLTDVLEKMVCKNYIITAMSIVEAVFAYLVRESGNWKTSEWKSIHKINVENAKGITFQGETLKVITELYKKVDAYTVEMQTGAIIDKIKSKHLMTFKSEKAFNVLKKYTALRNKVHLHIRDDVTDYRSFDREGQIQMKIILRAVLINKTVCSDETRIDDVYGFLNLTNEDKEQIGIN